MTARRRFWHVASAGIAFQAGSSAVDSATVMSALMYQLTGSTVAVGAITAILRLGWLTPQLFVGYLAGRGGNSMTYYIFGAFGRTAAIAALALILLIGGNAGWSNRTLGAATLGIWTLYAFLSGIVGVPYNDIVARSIPSGSRSRVLAVRFLGGGLVALVVAAAADRMVRVLDFPESYAAVLGMAALLMLVSSIVFTVMGDPGHSVQPKVAMSFTEYLQKGFDTFRTDWTFRRFVLSQWFGGAVLMAAPFFIVEADAQRLGFEHVALLLGVQTVGALATNPLWGWWGDRRGKLSLMRGIAIVRAAPPLVLLAVIFIPISQAAVLPILLGVFFVLGALANGLTIAVIGLLMEISPDGMRPAYSGYFNALTAPAFIFPFLGGFIAMAGGIWCVLLLAVAAAIGQMSVLASFSTSEQSPAK